MAIKSLRAWRFVCSAVLAAAALSGCGGGGGSTPTLSGVAAVGVPIVNGAVTVTCAGGGATTTTTSTGGWTVSSTGLTLPCAVQVSGGTVSGTANTTPYHSIAISFGTLNITPLTDLAVAQLLGTSPQTWFASPTFTNVNATALSAALNTLSTNLGIASTLGYVDPFTATFVAQNGDKIDDILEALKTTLSNQSQTYATLLAAAQANSYTTFSGFGTAFSTIYINLAGATSGATSCASGETLFVFSANSSVSSSYSNGQGVCFTGSSTSLSFSGKTLTNPVQNTAVTSPFSAYKFTDASNAYEYEVVFSSGSLYEINLTIPPQFAGQFAAPVAGAGGSGSATLTIGTTVAGFTTNVVVNGVTQPANQSDFCTNIQSDSSITTLQSQGTFNLISCSYAGNTGTISASVTSMGVTVPYTITYTYS